MLNVLEDTQPEKLWRWEVREVRTLAHDLRPVVAQGKKRAKAAQDLLSALDALLDALPGEEASAAAATKALARAQRAWDAYCKADKVGDGGWW